MTRRIALLIHSLDGGGAERMAALMANEWSNQGHRVSLITLDSTDQDRYPIQSGVERIGLGLMSDSQSWTSRIARNLGRVRALRRAIEEQNPDVCVSLIDKMNITALIAAKTLATDVIICEHTDPRQHSIGRMWELMRRRTYPRCKAMTVLTDSVSSYASHLTKGRPIYVLPNFVEPSNPPATERSESRSEKIVITMGRLIETKGFDQLIESFARCHVTHSEWKLIILGDGPERNKLERLVQAHRLSECVEFPGWIDDPTDYLSRSSLFALTSRYEGFPMALLEAMACGIPAVSYDCESGPRAIIRDDVDGILVKPNSIDELTDALSSLMSDLTRRQSLGNRAQEVVQRFGKELYFRRWDAIFDQTSIEDYRKLGNSD